MHILKNKFELKEQLPITKRCVRIITPQPHKQLQTTTNNPNLTVSLNLILEPYHNVDAIGYSVD